MLSLEVWRPESHFHLFYKNVSNMPTLYLGLIKVGEHSRNLSTVLEEISKYLEREKKYKVKVLSAMIYPIFISVVALLFSLGVVIKKNGKFVLKLPLFGKIIEQNETFKLLLSMFVLTDNSMDIVTALTESKSVLSNMHLISEMNTIIEGTTHGISLSESFGRSSFPSRVSSFIRIGEISGHISSIFGDLSNYYNELNDRRVEQLMALVDPLFTIIIGVVLILMIVNFILPVLTHMGAIM